MSVFVEFVRSCGVWLMSSFLFVQVMSNVLSVASNMWLNRLTGSSKNQTTQQQANVTNATTTTTSDVVVTSDEQMFNFFIFVALSFVHCVVSFLADYVFLQGVLTAAAKTHGNMLDSILRSTMEFFELTPSGRIINRFSKDIAAIERNMPDSFK